MIESAAVGQQENVSFTDLGLGDEVLRALSDAGYQHPTPIQHQAIPIVLMGRDILGAPGDVAAAENGFGLGQVGIGNAYRHFASECGGARFHGIEQSKVIGKAAVHLPVAGDELPALGHGSSPR